MTGKCGRMGAKRHWRRGLAVLAALWLGAAAAGEKSAATANYIVPDVSNALSGKNAYVVGMSGKSEISESKPIRPNENQKRAGYVLATTQKPVE